MGTQRAIRWVGTTIVAAVVAHLSLVTRVVAADDWKSRWQTTLAAAEKEGAINVSGPAGKLWRDLLLEFEKAHPKIKISVTPFASRDFWPRLLKEREVGKHLWDIRVGGADTQVYTLAKAGGLGNVREMLILPEVADEANWHGGFDHMFTDLTKKFTPSFTAYKSPLANYNPKFVKPDEMKSFQSLLDPKWKGKIALADPRGGSTAVSMAIVYKKFGADFIRELLTKQEPVIVKNSRQIMDWFVSGKYPIALGIPNSSIIQYQEKGVAFEMGEVSGLDIWSVGVGGLQVMEPRPNPNATTVFVNWILSKDVQARIMPAVKLNSRRKDVAPGDKDRVLEWHRYKDFVSGQSEEFHQAMIEFKKLTRELLQ